MTTLFSKTIDFDQPLPRFLTVANWADRAVRGDVTDGTDVAETALRMNTPLYFDWS